MYHRDLYITNDVNLNFLQELKNYFDDKEENLSIHFFDEFDEEKYLSYLNEALKSLENIKNLEDENSYHFFDYWVNTALEIFVSCLWRTRYKINVGKDSEKTKAANFEVQKFKEYMNEYNLIEDLESGDIQSLH